MLNYKKLKLTLLDDSTLENIYIDLLANKWQFMVLDINGKLKVLTKEKSLFDIVNEDSFVSLAKEDIYYRTIITNKKEELDMADLLLYRKYISRYASQIEKVVYGGKYIFGSIAVKTSNGIITTIRGKRDLKDFTFVNGVDHKEHTVKVSTNKATLNVPLYDYLFNKIKRAKVIVHINSVFDGNLPTLEYSFPGTQKDSIRDIDSSFNIRHHGIVYLFDENENLI